MKPTIAAVALQKFLELCRAPGVQNKLASIFLGPHSASSIAGLLGALCIVVAGSVASHLGVDVDWHLVLTVAVAVLLGGRGARPRKSKHSPTATQGASSGSVAPEPIRTSSGVAMGDVPHSAPVDPDQTTLLKGP